MAQCVTAAMDKNTLDFAPYLPTFMDLYLKAALLSVNARVVQKARAKRRVLLVRFLTAALLSNYYSTKWAKNQRERKPHPLLWTDTAVLCCSSKVMHERALYVMFIFTNYLSSGFVTCDF